MIFEQLVLKNFGIYQGEHLIDLNSTNHNKPIILFGGLNGGGKTTFLDSLQLVLYGKHAKCSNRGRLSYSEYLKQTINRYCEDKSTSIALSFRHSKGTSTDSYEVCRSWKANGHKELSDSITVKVNGETDNLLSTSWDDFVSEFIPQNMSELFFFDGEKIEDLADPARSAHLIRTGIEALLGLELFSQLSKDLNTLRQKRQERNLSGEAASRANEIKDRIDKLADNLSKKDSEIKDIVEKQDKLEQQLTNKQLELQSSGAHLLDSVHDIQLEEKNLSSQISGADTNLIRMAGSALPLLLAKDLFFATKEQAMNEKASAEQANSQDYVAKQNNSLISMLKDQLDNEALTAIMAAMNAVNEQTKQSSAKTVRYLNSSPDLFSFAYTAIENEVQECASILKDKATLVEQQALVQKKLEAVPDFSSVKDQIQEKQKLELQIEQCKHELEAAMEEKSQCNSQLQEQEARLNATLVQQNAETFEQNRNQQVASHLVEMKSIIDEFKTELIQENITKLERKIKSKFSSLERKSHLVSRIKIDSKSFVLTLIGNDGNPLEPKRLSAGERQLLSVAILWALADESGKEIPTIIDTPMGRLDGKHRTKLVEDYFPHASGQVLLLSTDEEITGQYYKKLKPYIAKEYHIQYDENKKSSSIESGYFAEEA